MLFRKVKLKFWNKQSLSWNVAQYDDNFEKVRHDLIIKTDEKVSVLLRYIVESVGNCGHQSLFYSFLRRIYLPQIYEKYKIREKSFPFLNNQIVTAIISLRRNDIIHRN